jgi:fatty acid desaturase
MDHKELVASLSPDLRARLTERSDRAGLWHLAGHMGAIGLCSGIILMTPLWPAALAVQGVLLVFLFTLEHECTHRTPFASDALSDWIGRGCGMVLILPFEWFRYFHLAHHRWTNLPGQDPEMDGEKPDSRAAWAWHVTGLPYWLAAARLMARLVMGQERARYLPDGALPRMRAEARWMILLYAMAAGSLFWSDAILWLWVVPVLIGQPFLRLYLLAEHGDAPMVANMLENSRTTFTNRIVRFLAWNMPYHAEHHSYPQVPFHHLPALHGVMRDHLATTADGFAAFTRAYLARRR